MAKRPGDFTQKTIDILAKRTGQICSNPNCNKSTSSGHTDKDKAVIIGEGAHIYGEAPGSKRYDSTMTDEERKDISNGIWLCSVCHKKVDSDEMKYTAKVLLNWKKDAENESIQLKNNQSNIIKPILDISLTGSWGSPKGHFRIFTVKNISNETAIDLHCYLKGFGYYWEPTEYNKNQIMLEPQKTKDIEYQMTISTDGLPPEKIPDLAFFVEYKNTNNDSFQIKKEIIQTPVPTNIYNDFSIGNYIAPKQIIDEVEIKFIKLLDNVGGGRNGLFKIIDGTDKDVKFGISDTLLATWNFSKNINYTEEAIKEIGILMIRRMIEKDDIKDMMLTSFEVPNNLQSGFENYKKFRDSL